MSQGHFPKKSSQNFQNNVCIKVDDELKQLMTFADQHGYDKSANCREALKAHFSALKATILKDQKQRPPADMSA